MEDQDDIRRDHAAQNLAGFLVVAADFLAMELSDGLPEDRSVAELVAIGRSAIARRLRQLRITLPSQSRRFDQALIQELVSCAVEAMVGARTSNVGCEPINPACSVAGRASPRSPKRSSGSH